MFRDDTPEETTVKTCTHCVIEFTPSLDDEGQPVYLDYHGAVSCDTCTCRLCGHGHPTADGHEDCAAAFEDGKLDPADPDVLIEIARDLLTGV